VLSLLWLSEPSENFIVYKVPKSIVKPWTMVFKTENENNNNAAVILMRRKIK
jgi:hypothetical protein